MKLINVDYINESSKAIFFNVTIEFSRFLRPPINVTRKAYLEKWSTNGGYGVDYRWCDTSEIGEMYQSVLNEMILKYEATKQTIQIKQY